MSSKIFKSKILLLLNVFSAGASQAWFCAAAQVIVPDVLPDHEAAVVAGHLADAVRNAGLVRSFVPPVVFPSIWTQSAGPRVGSSPLSSVEAALEQPRLKRRSRRVKLPLAIM